MFELADIEPYRGYDGLLSQKDLDQGDTSQRVSTLWILMCLLGRTLSTDAAIGELEKLTVNGDWSRFRRSSNPKYWGSRPSNFSRDQHSILNLCLAVLGMKQQLKSSFMAILKRGGFHQNFLRGTDDPAEKWKCPDPMTPTQVAVFLRGMDCWWAWPILLLIDSLFFLDLYFRRGNNDYDNMLAQNMMYSVTKYRNPLGIIAFFVYTKTDFLKHIQAYYQSSNGIPPLFDLYQECYLKVRGDLCESSWLFRSLSRLF